MESNRIRIALLFEFGTLNGGERSMLAALDRLADGPFEFVALAPAAGRLAGELSERGVEHVVLELRDASGARLPRRRACEKLADAVRRCHPALLHANSLSMGRLTGAIADKLRLPTVAHLRDIIKLSRAAIDDLNRNRLLLAVSEATKRYHVEQGLSGERTRVLYNGVDTDRFRPRGTGSAGGSPTGTLHRKIATTSSSGKKRATSGSGLCQSSGSSYLAGGPAALRRELGLPDDSFLVATIGQIGLRKGQDVLAEAAALLARRLPNVDYLLIGERYSSKDESVAFEQNVIARFEEAGIGSRLHRLGYRDDVERLMNEVDLLVHPAHQEPLGRVLLEAAASGLPIVATAVGGTGEILRDGESARLVSAGDWRALAEAIAELHGDPRKRAELATAARRRILAQFDVERTAREQAAVWHQMTE